MSAPPPSLDEDSPLRRSASSALASLRDDLLKVEGEILSLTERFADGRLTTRMDTDERSPPSSDTPAGMAPDQSSSLCTNGVVVASKGDVAIRENRLAEEQIAVETRFYTLCFDAEQLKAEEEDLLNEMKGEEKERMLAEQKVSDTAVSRDSIQSQAKKGLHDARDGFEREGGKDHEEEESRVMDSEVQAMATVNLENKGDGLREEGEEVGLMENQESLAEEQDQAVSMENSESKEKGKVFFQEEEETSGRIEEGEQQAHRDQDKREGEELPGQDIPDGEEEEEEEEEQQQQQGGQGEAQVDQVSVEEESEQQGGQGEEQIEQVSIEEENEQQRVKGITTVISEQPAYHVLRSTDKATLQENRDVKDVSVHNNDVNSTENLEEGVGGGDEEHNMQELESRISELFKQKAWLEDANTDLQDAVFKLRSDVQNNNEKTQRLVRIKEDIKKLEEFLEDAKEKAMALARKEEGLTTRIQELSAVADDSRRKGTKFSSPLFISGSTIVIVGLLVLFWRSRSKSAQ